MECLRTTYPCFVTACLWRGLCGILGGQQAEVAKGAKQVWMPVRACLL